MTTIEKDAPQPCEPAANGLATSVSGAASSISDAASGISDAASGGEDRFGRDASPAAGGNNRLSIFGGWCRLLVCLALLATAQQWVRYMRSPSSPAIQPTLARHASTHASTQQTAAGGEAVAAPQFMVDVNRAPQHELEALPEVGASLATRIVDYRQAQGPFRQIDDLLQVRGVGPRTLEQLRPMLLVRPPVEPVEY